MRLERKESRARFEERLNIEAVDADEQERRIHAAIARRAFNIYERRSSGFHEQEDWHQAESELISHLCVGRMSLDGSIWMSIDAAPFKEGTICIWVASRQLTICGMPRARRAEVAAAPDSLHFQEEMTYRTIKLPIEVDPSKITARFSGPFLEVLIAKAQAKSEEQVKAAAA
jgi:hypothetical protein